MGSGSLVVPVSEEEEDWFERAMREAEGESDSESDAEAADSPSTAAGDDTEKADTELATEQEASATEATEPTGTGDDEPVETDPFGGTESQAEPESDPFGGRSQAPSDPASDPFGGSDADSFGGSQDPFGGGGDFDDDDDALGGGGGFSEGEDSFGGSGEDGGPAFDEAELDSDIDRINVGIKGLDEMILGGIPKRSLMVTMGSAGTGKTTFGLQFLTEALENGDKAIYITLEESREAILSTAEEKGWPFREWNDEGQLAVVSMDPIEMANSLASIRNDISRLVEEYDADRLVLDSVSLLEMMYDHPAKRRSEVFDFARSLKRAGVTTMLTSEANSDDAYTSRYGIIEYLVDAVFILQYVRPSNFRETRLAVEIQKIRDANHSRETKPYEITNNGISVYRQANIF